MISWIPRWKDSPNFNAQAAHFFCGFSVAMAASYFKLPWLALPFFAYAGLKEFWYDAHYELPPQSFSNNLEDFCFYTAGYVAATLLSLL